MSFSMSQASGKRGLPLSFSKVDLGASTSSPDTSTKPPRPAYQVVLAAWVAHVVFVSCVYNFGVLLPPLQEEWPDASQSVLGLCGSFFQASFMGGGCVAGIVLPRLGARRGAMCGAVLAFAGFALASLVPSPYLLYPCLFLLGLGANVLWIGGMSIIPLHFPKTRNKMCGFAATGVGFGSMIMPAVWAPFFEEEGGWRAAFLVTAAICLAVGLLCAACYAPPPKPPAAATPSPAAPPAVAKPPSIWKNRVFVTFAVSQLFGCLGFAGSFTHLKSQAEAIGMGDGEIQLAYGIFGATSIVGRFLGGLLGDKLGTMNVFIGGLVCLCSCNAGVALSTGGISLTIFFGGMGLFSGPFIALLAPLMAELLGPARIAEAMGGLMLCNLLPFFASSLLMGLIKDLTGSFRYAYIYSALCFFTGSLAMLYVKRMKQAADLAAAKAAVAPKPGTGSEEAEAQAKI